MYPPAVKDVSSYGFYYGRYTVLTNLSIIFLVKVFSNLMCAVFMRLRKSENTNQKLSNKLRCF